MLLSPHVTSFYVKSRHIQLVLEASVTSRFIGLVPSAPVAKPRYWIRWDNSFLFITRYRRLLLITGDDLLSSSPSPEFGKLVLPRPITQKSIIKKYHPLPQETNLPIRPGTGTGLPGWMRLKQVLETYILVEETRVVLFKIRYK